MKFTILPAIISDVSEINTLVNSGYRGDVSKQGWTTEADLLDGTRADVALIDEILKRSGSQIVKYVENNEILGCMELRKNIFSALSREKLEEKLYGWDEEIESNTVEVYIHSLRKKLGQDFIKNIRGVGYMVPKPS